MLMATKELNKQVVGGEIFAKKVGEVKRACKGAS